MDTKVNKLTIDLTLAVDDAVVRGRLFETPSGIPVLEVPETDILAVGTADPSADVATYLRADTRRQAQARFAARMPDPGSTPDRLPKNATDAPWGPVYGELLTFDDPETRLLAKPRSNGQLTEKGRQVIGEWTGGA